MRPGCVSSASIEVEVYGGQSGAIEDGEELTYYQVDSEGNETLIGTFYAEPTIQTKNTYRFSAYDSVSKLDVDFSARLTEIQNNFPMTLSALVGEACTVAGVTLIGTFPMSTMEVQAFSVPGVTCRQILSWAAEIACRFVRCDTSGNIKFDWYTEVSNYRITPGEGSDNNETYIYYKQDGLHYENYTTTALARVAVHPTDDEQIAYVYPSGVTTGNTLDITNNILLTGATETVYTSAAQNIYTTMSALGTYRPAEISLFPFNNPFRAGDIVKVTDIQGVSFVTPVMTMTVQESVAQLDSTGNNTYSDSSNSIQELLINLADNIVRIKNLKVDWADIGTAVIQTLQANGINADWINAGALTVTDSNGHILFKADKENKMVTIGGMSAGYGLLADFPSLFSLRGETVINLEDRTNAARVQYGPAEIDFYLDEDWTGDEATNLVGYISAGNVIHLDPGLSGFTIGSDDAVYIRVPTANDFVVESDPVYGIYRSRHPLTEIGTLSSLTTTAKTSLVVAINEVKADLTPTISNNTGSTVSVATGTTTNLMSVTLTPGKYLLIGTATFQANSAGYRSLGFAKSASSATENRFSQSTVAAGSGFTPRVQVMTAWNLTTTTTVYLNAAQTSGSTLSVTAPGIQAIRLQDLS